MNQKILKWGPAIHVFYQDFQLIVMDMKFESHSVCFLESPWELAETLIERLHPQNKGALVSRILQVPK